MLHPPAYERRECCGLKLEKKQYIRGPSHTTVNGDKTRRAPQPKCRQHWVAASCIEQASSMAGLVCCRAKEIGARSAAQTMRDGRNSVRARRSVCAAPRIIFEKTPNAAKECPRCINPCSASGEGCMQFIRGAVPQATACADASAVRGCLPMPTAPMPPAAGARGATRLAQPQRLAGRV